MTWTTLSYSFGSILTSTKMTQNQDNFTALANGDSGSPKIQEAAITGQAAVDQSAIKTTTATLAGSASSPSKTTIVLTAYCFFPMIHIGGGSTSDVAMTGSSTDSADPDLPRFAFKNNSGSSHTYDVDYRYIQA
jgi:hypothetical protein